jgi:hypothetical protein
MISFAISMASLVNAKGMSGLLYAVSRWTKRLSESRGAATAKERLVAGEAARATA